jgi:murein DD-endopeptidase MepM/ murein hydrolase activator NlpD
MVRGLMAAMVCVVSLAADRAIPPLRITSTAKSIRVGDVVLLTITGGPPLTGPRVHALGHEWPPFAVDARTWQVLVGIDLEVKPGRYTVEVEAAIPSDGTRTTYPLLVKPRAFRTRTLSVDPALVTPPPEMRERIEREARMLADLWTAPASAKSWDGPFVRPVPDAANSAFGTRSVYNGEPRSPHNGTDFLSPAGRPVEAPNSGRVVVAESLYFTGGTIVIDHGLGLFSLFAHLSEIDVKVGDGVTTGTAIGKVGATGRVTGPHLHWSVRDGGARVDPLSLLAALGARPLNP